MIEKWRNLENYYLYISAWLVVYNQNIDKEPYHKTYKSRIRMFKEINKKIKNKK
jgi:hypothetical protein